MRPTFALNLDLQPISVSAPKTTPHPFKVGDVLWITADFPYENGTVPRGTKLFVSHVSQDDGTMWLLCEGNVPALYHVDNMLVASPYDTEDLLPHLNLRSPEEAAHLEPVPSNVCALRTLAVLAACFLFAGLVSPHKEATRHHLIYHSANSSVHGEQHIRTLVDT